MKKFKSKHNDLLNYFIYDNRLLSQSYLKKCKEFFKKKSNNHTII